MRCCTKLTSCTWANTFLMITLTAYEKTIHLERHHTMVSNNMQQFIGSDWPRILSPIRNETTDPGLKVKLISAIKGSHVERKKIKCPPSIQQHGSKKGFKSLLYYSKYVHHEILSLYIGGSSIKFGSSQHLSHKTRVMKIKSDNNSVKYLLQ